MNGTRKLAKFGNEYIFVPLSLSLSLYVCVVVFTCSDRPSVLKEEEKKSLSNNEHPSSLLCPVSPPPPPTAKIAICSLGTRSSPCQRKDSTVSSTASSHFFVWHVLLLQKHLHHCVTASMVVWPVSCSGSNRFHWFISSRAHSRYICSDASSNSSRATRSWEYEASDRAPTRDTPMVPKPNPLNSSTYCVLHTSLLEALCQPFPHCI